MPGAQLPYTPDPAAPKTPMPNDSHIDTDFIRSNKQTLLANWLRTLAASGRSADRRTTQADVEQQAGEFLDLLSTGLQGGNVRDIDAANWAPLRAFLEHLSTQRAQQGFSADQTASFIFSFKQVLFELLLSQRTDKSAVVQQMFNWTELIDSFGLHTFSA